MYVLVRSARVFMLPALLVAAGMAGQAQAPTTGVSLKVSREVAPPGVIAQMKVFITEPKPITTGYAWIEFDAFSEVVGIALPFGETAGMAVVHGGTVALSVLSPSGAFGTDPDYPVLTIAGRVPPTAPLGVRIPMTIDPAALQLIDPTGLVYPAEVKDGYLLGGGSLAISDVVPGSGDVPAGGVVSIFGSGFRPDTRVHVKETPLAAEHYISPERIDVVLAQPAHMHGKAIRAKNKDGSEVTYFSYQRTRRSAASAHPVLKDVVPIFPDRAAERQSLDISEATAGLALQNADGTDSFAFLELLDADGTPVAAGYVDVPASSFVVRSLTEIFGLPTGTTGVVTLNAVSPLQMLGVDLDAAGRTTPRLAR